MAATAAVASKSREAIWVGGGAAAVAGGGEKSCTRGLKLRPLRVFTMAGLEKERRGWDSLE